jgi:formylglycine-generating enzyme
MRAIALCLIALTVTACSTERCKKGTVLLTVSLTNGAEAANYLDVGLAIDSGETQTRSVTHVSGSSSGTIEVDFSAYPSGKSLAFIVTARADEQTLATMSETTTAIATCTALSFTLDAVGVADLAGSDGLATPDMTPSGDMVFVAGPSCTNLAANCGASINDNCCNSPVVIGGTYKRSYDVANDNMYPDQTHPATVSDFRLDRYEVTVGRFRKFVIAGMGTQANPPAVGAGANPYTPSSGWTTSFNASLAADTSALTAALKCDATYQTWTDGAGANENNPINCITWFEAVAFCAWDGGFVPTEAEWNYAATGGNEQRAYPWSNPPPALDIDCPYANYMINTPTGTYCVNGTTGAVNNVGSESPKGDGKWGQSDLGGNVFEWVLDWYASPYSDPCSDCANLAAAPDRVIRGGGFFGGSPGLRAGYRYYDNPVGRNRSVGFRCARTK